MAAVVFTVDWESRSGIPPIPNEEIAEAAAANPDVLIAVRERRPGSTRRGRARPSADLRARRQGLQVPPQPAGVLPERPQRLPAVRGHRGSRAAGALPHGPQRHRHGSPRRRGLPPQVLEPDVPGRRRGRLPGAPDRPRAPLVPLAGRGHLGVPAQGERLDRPLGLVAEVLLRHSSSSTRTRS